MSEILTQKSASELARSIRDGETSSRDILEAHIGEIERWNPHLNAVVRKRYNEARHEADIADAQIQKGDFDPAETPFLGVPCTIKECFGLTGMPQTAGLKARKGEVAHEDAAAVARIRKLWRDSHGRYQYFRAVYVAREF